MANDQQFKLRTLFVGTRGVKEYRASIPHWVTHDDVVLEIGCEWGTTSVLLAPHCRELIATDISADCIGTARERHPHIRFETLDAYDLPAALAFDKRFTKIYIDVSGLSGYRSLLDLIALLNMYSTMFDLDAIIVKSGALKNFATRCIPFVPAEAQLRSEARHD